MKLTINGTGREAGDLQTVADLLRTLELPAVRVAVELNGELVARDRHADTPLAEGDCLEIVTFVGGG